MTFIYNREYNFKHVEAEEVIEKLAGLDDYDEEAVLKIIRGIGFDLFEVLDEKPGYFGYGFNGKEWHWKLRRARNDAPGFFDAINA